MVQLYIPCGIYILVAVCGLITVGLSRRKLRMDKAAKIVAKGKATPPKTEEKH